MRDEHGALHTIMAGDVGALPEIIRHGVDGFLVDDLDEAELAVRLVGRLDRAAIRERALERFSSARMTDQYEAIYRRLMVCQREAGDPAGALTTYRRCRELLSIVLSRPPSPETEAVRATLR